MISFSGMILATASEQPQSTTEVSAPTPKDRGYTFTESPIHHSDHRPIHDTEIPEIQNYAFSQRVAARFKIDNPYSFQLEAINHINNGNSVVVSAPTGTGKTLVAHAAILRALEQNKEAIYTVPTKALANEKYRELQRLFPDASVGICTGDRQENPKAQIKVMTTEIYTYSVIDHTGTVIFDEAHNISDPQRGQVWESAFLNTPKSIQQVALTASVANGEEFVEWLNCIHSEEVFKYVSRIDRAVPIEYKVIDKSKLSMTQEPKHWINYLKKNDFLPIMYVYFNKQGCDKQCKKLVMAQTQGKVVPLLTEPEQQEVNKIIDRVLKAYPSLGNFEADINALRRGIASHHSGKIPLLKSLIEQLLDKNLLKVAFCTETLATGIDKPVRTVFLSTCKKDVGSRTRYLTASEFTQLIGRAGRRNFHKQGTAIILCANQAECTVVNRFLRQGPVLSNIISFFGFDYRSLLRFIKKNNLSELDGHLNSTLARHSSKKLFEKISTIERFQSDFQREFGSLADPTIIKELTRATKNELAYLRSAMDIARSTNQQDLNIAAKIELLKKLDYIRPCSSPGAFTLTPKGIICSKITMNNPIFITELITNPELYQNITPAKFAALISCFTHYKFKQPIGFIENPTPIDTLIENHSIESQVNAIFDVGCDLDALNKEIQGADLPTINYDTRLFTRILDWANETDPDTNINKILAKYNMKDSPNTFIKEIKEVIEFLRRIVSFDELTDDMKSLINAAIDTLYKGELIRSEDIEFKV